MQPNLNQSISFKIYKRKRKLLMNREKMGQSKKVHIREKKGRDRQKLRDQQLIQSLTERINNGEKNS
jgi:hypothetical protein